MPGAASVPLFDNDERAQVGKTYANTGHDDAVLKGLQIVGPKIATLATRIREVASHQTSPSTEIFLHCWRGGMRSQSVAWLCGTVGLEPILLKGGYKAFRSHARSTITGQWKLMVLSGLTGAGKTRYLNLLRETGEQVCDLERLANHRGSAYGGIGQGEQPTTEQFENDLFECLSSFDKARRIWVEDEGNRIGQVVVPIEFYRQIRHAPAVFLDVDQDVRISNLMRDYKDLPRYDLQRATKSIGKRLGNDHLKNALECIERGQIAEAMSITLNYYDRAYNKAADTMPRTQMPRLPVAGLSDPDVMRRCIEIADQIGPCSQPTPHATESCSPSSTC